MSEQRFLILDIETADREINAYLDKGWRVVPGTVVIGTTERSIAAREGRLMDVRGRTVEGWLAITLEKA
jgi:hypothetical protein